MNSLKYNRAKVVFTVQRQHFCVCWGFLYQPESGMNGHSTMSGPQAAHGKNLLRFAHSRVSRKRFPTNQKKGNVTWHVKQVFIGQCNIAAPMSTDEQTRYQIKNRLTCHMTWQVHYNGLNAQRSEHLTGWKFHFSIQHSCHIWFKPAEIEFSVDWTVGPFDHFL